jgi:hypothetical protein
VPGRVLLASAATQETWTDVPPVTTAVAAVGSDPAPTHGLADVATITAISPRAKIPSIQRFGTMDPTDPSIGYLLRSARLMDQNTNTVFVMALSVVKPHSRNRYFEC